MNTLTEDIVEKIIDLTNLYLQDAGFTKQLYKIEIPDECDCIKVFFEDHHAIDFIIIDIQKTDFKNSLIIKKHKIKPNNYYASFNFRFD